MERINCGFVHYRWVYSISRELYFMQTKKATQLGGLFSYYLSDFQSVELQLIRSIR
jgi:hypothetical protein